MSDGFYLADEKHQSLSGQIVETKGVLFFKLEKAGFDGKATHEHVKNFSAKYEAFKAANPSYVPALEEHLEIGKPGHSALLSQSAEVAKEEATAKGKVK